MRFFAFLLVVVGLVACLHNDNGHNNILPQDKMKLVLFDVLRAQEYALLKYAGDTTATNKNMAIMLQQVFNIHKISKEDFYDSFSYYEAHPNENKQLFDSLSTYTNQKRQDIYSHLR